MQVGWQFWIDRGGTFTDVVGKAPDGSLHVHKLLSENPEQYGDAAIQGMRDLLELKPGEPLPDPAIDAVKMGTTVATNAPLSEGTPTVLAITRGLGDALRIGYQHRPDIFARHIVLPEQLHTHTIEIEERLQANGTVIQPLDRARTRADLKLFAAGYRAVAIVLAHGYRYRDHEQIGGRDRAAGRLHPGLGEPRGQPADEAGRPRRHSPWSTPIFADPARLRRPGRGVTGQVRLMFMQSNGGLVDAHLFQGKDAILSGPAGGIVGAARTAALAGFERIIGFDMGGTSTDVTHYAGAFERAFDTEVAGRACARR